MASDRPFVNHVCEQMAGAGTISARQMFGEYAIYCDEKIVALVCDNQLFVKPTPAGKVLLGAPTEARPFPEAKPYFLIDDGIDDPESLVQLIRVTARALPAPKPKVAKKKIAKKKAKRQSRPARP
jgi:TfoX/Sxy family transcriptional regulator of competence genes